MDCRKAEELLHLWMDDELDESDRAALTAHLAECSACAKKLAEYRHLDTLLAQIDAQTNVPAGLYGRIMDAVNRESEPQKSGVYRWTRWAASAAAVLLLGVTVGVLWRAGIWPVPMGKTARNELAQDVAPQEAPAAEMEAGDTLMGAGSDDKGVVMDEPAEATSEEADFGRSGEAALRGTWTPAKEGTGIEAIEAFCREQGIEVTETGPDWITIRWADDTERQAVLDFLGKSGVWQAEEQDSMANTLVINIRLED